jgi:hypothetical protein
MERHPISVRPTAAQLQWLKRQREKRGININTQVIMALELLMATDQDQASKAEKA